MKAKSKPERRQKITASVARETTPLSPALCSFPVIALAASTGGLKALSVIPGGLPAGFPAAIAVVLTDGDSDGSFRVPIVKDKGGKVLAQDRPTSQDFSMPETSIKTGDVDFILPLDETAPKLIELVGAGQGQASDRTTAQRRKPTQGPGKLVTPCHPTGSQAVKAAGKTR